MSHKNRQYYSYQDLEDQVSKLTSDCYYLISLLNSYDEVDWENWPEGKKIKEHLNVSRDIFQRKATNQVVSKKATSQQSDKKTSDIVYDKKLGIAFDFSDLRKTLENLIDGVGPSYNNVFR